jgi:hypothetical protein
VGVLIAKEEIAREINKLRLPFNITYPFSGNSQAYVGGLLPYNRGTRTDGPKGTGKADEGAL